MRARAADLAHVSFIHSDVRTLPLDQHFDAIVGRLILLYMADPVAALRTLLGHLRAGGIVAFQEIDWTTGPAAVPPSPLLTQTWQWVTAMFTRAGLPTDMGLRLHAVFVAAGLPPPAMHLDAPVGGGPTFAGYDYIARGLRSNLPPILRHGIATAEEVDIDTYEQRLRDQVVGQEGAIMLPAFVGAWAHKR